MTDGVTSVNDHDRDYDLDHAVKYDDCVEMYGDCVVKCVYCEEKYDGYEVKHDDCVVMYVYCGVKYVYYEEKYVGWDGGCGCDCACVAYADADNAVVEVVVAAVLAG